MENKDFIYTRDLDILVWGTWRNLMQSIIKTLDNYISEENNYANNLYIHYVKDKYWYLRSEYYWWDDYTDDLLSIAEDLSYYMKEVDKISIY